MAMHPLDAAVTALMRDVAARLIVPRFRALAAHEIHQKTPGDLVTIADHESEVALGEGLSRTGSLDSRAMDRAYEALALCGERVARKGVESSRLMAVATQACRQAENGPAFIERVRRGTGLKLRIIDPVEEARLAVRGCLNLFDPSVEAVLVVDVGGGSTGGGKMYGGRR